MEKKQAQKDFFRQSHLSFNVALTTTFIANIFISHRLKTKNFAYKKIN